MHSSSAPHFGTNLSSNNNMLNNSSNFSIDNMTSKLDHGDPPFNENSLFDVVIYAILLILSACGNLTVFNALLRNRNRIKLRINLVIFNLTIADLIVTFVMIPLEIGWRLTQSWIAGDFMCKIMMTLRAFGPYLSSMVLVCISLDRYFAIIHPFKSNNTERSKKMLIFAWIISLVCSLPQVSRWYFYFFTFYFTFSNNNLRICYGNYI